MTDRDRAVADTVNNMPSGQPTNKDFIERLIDLAPEICCDLTELQGFIKNLAKHLGVDIEVPDLWKIQEERVRNEPRRDAEGAQGSGG